MDFSGMVAFAYVDAVWVGRAGVILVSSRRFGDLLAFTGCTKKHFTSSAAVGALHDIHFHGGLAGLGFAEAF